MSETEREGLLRTSDADAPRGSINGGSARARTVSLPPTQSDGLVIKRRADSVPAAPLEVRVLASQELADAHITAALPKPVVPSPGVDSSSARTFAESNERYQVRKGSAFPEEKVKGCKNDWEEAPEGHIKIYDRATQAGREGVPGVPQHLLGQFLATSIAGNDITSSCLYSSGTVAQAAGIMSPFASLFVAIVLFLFRSIYTEACTALPMNGGSYNILLNTTTKFGAALAAVLSLLSYTATAVVSATSAAQYLNYGSSLFPVELCSIVILIVFALLLLLGVKDSARTAAVIFSIHMLTMLVLIAVAFVSACQDGWRLFRDNWYTDSIYASPQSNLWGDLFYGYAMGLLGITGFESSANYIEEQKVGVFAKTLRNMWACVAFLNPVLAVLCIAGLPIQTLVQQSTYSLAILGDQIAGAWLKYLVIADATLVLCGAVLAGYVGVTGLIRRLALDDIMPKVFLRTNRFRHTNHWIIFFFCFVSCSLRLLVSNIDTLSGVYSIAFLGVMSLFDIGTMVLKAKRGGLKREVVTPLPQCFLALALLITGIVGQILMGSAAQWFLLYFTCFAIVVICTMQRVIVLRGLVQVTQKAFPRVADFLRRQVKIAREQPMVFFCKSQPLSKLNKVVQYVMSNENTVKLQFCHFTEGNGDDPYVEYLKECCALLDRLYPKITVEMILVRGAMFEPETVRELSGQIGVPRHFMFVGCPDDKFPHSFGDFGGVRVITH